MKVVYYHQLPRENPVETELDLDDLPPLASRELKRNGLESLCSDFFYSEFLNLWWWVRPAVPA